jgi:hypothetical protein
MYVGGGKTIETVHTPMFGVSGPEQCDSGHDQDSQT